ncbi:MAG: 2-oxoacid:acceptor oxidoreductase family protein [Anaerolineaceae bacterium]|nr:2-oxoacid:acceptor oxidoreductase family protein [Anaerolineaceae bacterium]
MEAQFLIAGFGGQGVLLIGQLLAKAAMHEGMNVSWMPSYGPEMRGGEANCAVVISDEPIGSPLVTEIPIAVIMNKPSMIKFTPAMETGGVMLYNSSLIDIVPDRKDITAIPVDCNSIAEELGNSRTANMVMLGAILARTGVVSIDSAMEALKATFGPKKEHLLPINRQAMERGAEAVKNL